MAALREGANDIEQAGGQIVAVTQGDAEQAQALCERFETPFTCYADPALGAYKEFGLRRGSTMEVMGPSTWAAGIDAARKGHFIERPIGDVMQLPGTFIIDRDGIVRWKKEARHSADHPRVRDIVAALKTIG